MDFLKAEIERKKRQIQEKNVLQPQKKYFKRGDLLAVQVKLESQTYLTFINISHFSRRQNTWTNMEYPKRVKQTLHQKLRSP